jgi:hypothetical protein
MLFFFWRNFAKLGPEKYDLNLYKGFFHGKNDPNSPDLEGKTIQIARF